MYYMSFKSFSLQVKKCEMYYTNVVIVATDSSQNKGFYIYFFPCPAHNVIENKCFKNSNQYCS